MLGMYISFVLFDQCGLDPFVAIPIVAVVMFAFGALLQSTLITRSLHGNDDTNVLFLTVGLGILFQNVALLYFKSDYRTAQSMFSEKIVQLGAINLSLPKVLSFCDSSGGNHPAVCFLKVYQYRKADSRHFPEQYRSPGLRYQNKAGLCHYIRSGSCHCRNHRSLSDVLYYVFPTVGAVYGTRSFIVVNHGRTGKCYRSLCQRHCIGTYGNRGSRGCGFLL